MCLFLRVSDILNAIVRPFKRFFLDILAEFLSDILNAIVRPFKRFFLDILAEFAPY